MSPAHCDKNPSDFQVHGAAFIATKPRPLSRDVLRQKTVRLPGIRQLDIATSRPTSGDSTWQHRKNGHFLNCGQQINGVLLVASHGVQASNTGRTVVMSQRQQRTACPGRRCRCREADHAHRKGSSRHASQLPPYEKLAPVHETGSPQETPVAAGQPCAGSSPLNQAYAARLTDRGDRHRHTDRVPSLRRAFQAAARGRKVLLQRLPAEGLSRGCQPIRRIARNMRGRS